MDQLKLALVVGGAGCVWSDVERANQLVAQARKTEEGKRPWDAVYCVKMAGIFWPEAFEVWATLHPEAMDDYEKQRIAKGFPAGYEIVAPLQGELGDHKDKGNVARRVSYRWPGMTGSASSGIYGAKVALEDGYRVVLAGVPMLKEGGHFMPQSLTVRTKRPRGNIWLERGSFDSGMVIAMPLLKKTNVVRSMSGYTREILGEPTPEWLAGS